MNPTGLNVTPETSTFVTSGAVLLLAQSCRWRAPDATVALADHAVRLARSENRVENALLAEGWLAHGLVVIGHGATAAPRAASALAEATRVGATAAAGRLRVELASIARTVDATEQAQRLLDPVLALSDAEPLLRADACLEAAMGPARGASESRELLDTAIRVLNQLGGEEAELGLAHVDALAASRARMDGRLTEAVKRARDGLTRSLGNSMTGGALEPVSPHLTTLLCYELCQALVANGHPEPVPEIARPILGWAVRPGSLVPAARLHLLLASAVQRPTGAFEDALASATWVAEAIESRDLPELEALCQTVLGEIWDSSGNLAEAVGATRRAHLAHRAHSERVGQLRALLIQVAGGKVAPPSIGRSEPGHSDAGRPAQLSEPRALGRRVARRFAEDDAADSAGPSDATNPPGSPRLPGRPLDVRRENRRDDQPKHGRPANGHRATNGFHSGPPTGEVTRSVPERPGDRTSAGRLPGGDLPSGPVDPAFSNEFGASVSQFAEAGTTPPGDPGPPTLPRGLSGRISKPFGTEPEPTVAPRLNRSGPPPRHGGPDSDTRRDDESGPALGGRRRRPSPDDESLEASGNGPAHTENVDDADLPGVLWLSPDTRNAAPSPTGSERVPLTEQELADVLADSSPDARPAHLVVLDISMPDGSRCGPAARTVADRVADQLDGQRPPGARLYLLGPDTVTVSLTDPDPESVNRWLRTVSGGISRRWTTLAAELPTVATFRIVVRPLDPRWSMSEHLAEVRARLHPDGDAARSKTERPSRRTGIDAPPAPEDHTPSQGRPSQDDSSDQGDSSGWDRALERTDAADDRERRARARHSAGGQEPSEDASSGHRQWLTAPPGSGGRRRRPDTESPLAPASAVSRQQPVERDPLTDPDPFGMSSPPVQRPLNRRDSAAVADHAHPEGWPVDDEPEGSSAPGRAPAGELDVSERFVPTDSGSDASDQDRPERHAAVEGGLGAPEPTESSGGSAGVTDPLTDPLADPLGSAGPAGVLGVTEDDAAAPSRTDDNPAPTETDASTDRTTTEGRRQRGRGEISTLAMEAVAPPGSAREAEKADGESPAEPEKPPARNWDRPMSELSFAELIDGALAAYREA